MTRDRASNIWIGKSNGLLRLNASGVASLDEVYRIGREAVVDALRHAHAKRIEVEVEYKARHLRIVIRDDGCRINTQVLQSKPAGHRDLSSIGERASHDRFGGTWRALAVLLSRRCLCGILVSTAPARSHQEDYMSNPPGDEALDQLFREARTHIAWLDRPVTDDTLRQLYDFLSFAAGLGIGFQLSSRSLNWLAAHLQSRNPIRSSSAREPVESHLPRSRYPGVQLTVVAKNHSFS
jgi:hypothetical protein